MLAAFPGAYQIGSPPDFRLASKTSMASWVDPMLEPSAMYLHPAAMRPSASSLDTSFWVAEGRATSTWPTCNHGRAPWTYLNLDPNSASEVCRSLRYPC